MKSAVELWRDFIQSDQSVNYWTEGPDRMLSRGIPNKIPYAVMKFKHPPANMRPYWEHYGYSPMADVKWFKEFIDLASEK
jgi:hypothetical protein